MKLGGLTELSKKGDLRGQCKALQSVGESGDITFNGRDENRRIIPTITHWKLMSIG